MANRPPRRIREGALKSNAIKWAALAFRDRSDIPSTFFEECRTRKEAVELAEALKKISFTRSVWIARRKF